MLVGGVFGVFAGTMDKATTVTTPDGYGQVMDGQIVSSASSMVLTWGEQEVTFVEGAEIYFDFTIPTPDGEEPYTTDKMTEVYLGTSTYGTPPDKSEYVTLSLGYLYTAGEYTVSIPAGIVQNSAGDTNPAQTFTYTRVAYSNTFGLSSYSGCIITPESDSMIEKTDDMKVTIEWTNELELTNYGQVTAYCENYDDRTNIPASISDGKLVLDISNLTVSQTAWKVSVPDGLVKGYNDDDDLCINNSSTLYYTIYEVEPLTEYSVTYPTNKYNQSLYNVQISFGGQPIQIVENKANEITLIDPEGELVDITSKIENQTKLNVAVNGGSVSVGGEYTVNIPAGVITNGKYQNEAIEAQVMVLPLEYIYTINPIAFSGGTKVPAADLTEVTFTFAEGSTIEYLDNEEAVSKLYIGTGAGQDVVELKYGEDLNIQGNKIILTMPSDLQQTQYAIGIAQYSFLITSPEGKISGNPYMSPTYIVWDGLPDATLLNGPEDYGTMIFNDESNIELTWDYEAIELTDDFEAYIEYYNSSYDNVQYVFSEDEVEIVTVTDPATGAQVPGNALRINLAAALSEITKIRNTSLNFYLKEGSVAGAGDRVNSEFSINYFSAYEETDEVPEFIADEEEGVYNLVWSEATGISLEEYYVYLDLKNQSGETVSTLMGYYYSGEGYYSYSQPNMLIFSFGDLEEGTYTMALPAALVALTYGEYPQTTTKVNGEMTVTLVVGSSAIESAVEPLEGNYTVYNLNGVKVLDTDDSSRLKDLAKGIYIINGKKVILK